MTFSKDGCAVTLDDAVVDPYHYKRQILQGFRNTVAAAMTIDADEWDAMLSGEDTTVRVLVRNTSAYARFADFIHHPVGVKDMLDVEAILENLYVYPFRDKRIFASEYRQMLAGDIPMFTAQLTGHDLHAPDGTTIDGVCDVVRERVLDTIGILTNRPHCNRALSATPCAWNPAWRTRIRRLRCRRTRMRSITQSNSARG